MTVEQAPNRFTLGVFPSIMVAEETLRVAETLKMVNESVLRASGIILDSPEYKQADGVTDYAMQVMAEQATTIQDIEDIKKVIEEMRELEGMFGSAE